MTTRTAMLLGAAAAALSAAAAVAAPAPALEPATSYADLLAPISNPVEKLQAVYAEDAMRPPQVIEAQYHHHHHDSAWYRANGYIWSGGAWILAPAHHHHHHHNRRWYLRNGYIWSGGAWVLRPAVHHHHHHHHHSNY